MPENDSIRTLVCMKASRQLATRGDKGLGASEIAKSLKIGRASVYRALAGKQGSSKSPSDANSLGRSRGFVWGPGDLEHH